MDITLIIVIAIGAVFIIGGSVAGHYATKASQKEFNEIKKNEK